MGVLLLFKRPQVPRRDYPEALEVGTCGGCGSPVLYRRDLAEATCVCGGSRIPRAFMLVASHQGRFRAPEDA